MAGITDCWSGFLGHGSVSEMVSDVNTFNIVLEYKYGTSHSVLGTEGSVLRRPAY